MRITTQKDNESLKVCAEQKWKQKTIYLADDNSSERICGRERWSTTVVAVEDAGEGGSFNLSFSRMQLSLLRDPSLKVGFGELNCEQKFWSAKIHKGIA
ncbi:uncharacterized protein G2W53_037940 [Senna tora]|uniref:Uncharacterized protein n=1 Tax=Senna tora TaxID=362788 RepID=A0A834SL00_9FABA|nr:uncharacterized protein G2W53_037940 [Senna tora]